MAGTGGGASLKYVRAVAIAVVLASAGCTELASKPTESESPVTVGTATVTPTTAKNLPEPGTAALARAKAATLQHVLDRVVAENSAGIESGARGITAAVLTDQWTWTGVAGADGTGRRLQNNTTMAIASITKTFVAAEVLRLAGAGTVELDKPLSMYVKHKLTANGATVRQHLAMRAGLPDFLPGDYQALEKEFAEAPSRHWTPAQVLAHHSAALGGPGSPFAYSNPSYLLLGMLVENVTQQPLAAVLRRDLVTPARLARVAVQDGERPPPPVANTRIPFCPGRPDGYLPCRAVASATMAAGGMAADAASVARWGYQLYGGRVVPPAIVTAMTGGDSEYGLGTMRFSLLLGLGEAYGHIGMAPGYTTMLAVVPQKRLAAAILLADSHRNANTVMSRLFQAIQEIS